MHRAFWSPGWSFPRPHTRCRELQVYNLRGTRPQSSPLYRLRGTWPSVLVLVHHDLGQEHSRGGGRSAQGRGGKVGAWQRAGAVGLLAPAPLDPPPCCMHPAAACRRPQLPQQRAHHLVEADLQPGGGLAAAAIQVLDAAPQCEAVVSRARVAQRKSLHVHLDGVPLAALYRPQDGLRVAAVNCCPALQHLPAQARMAGPSGLPSSTGSRRCPS